MRQRRYLEEERLIKVGYSHTFWGGVWQEFIGIFLSKVREG